MKFTFKKLKLLGNTKKWLVHEQWSLEKDCYPGFYFRYPPVSSESSSLFSSTCALMVLAYPEPDLGVLFPQAAMKWPILSHLTHFLSLAGQSCWWWTPTFIHLGHTNCGWGVLPGSTYEKTLPITDKVVIFIKDLKFKFKKNQKFNLFINKKDKKWLFTSSFGTGMLQLIWTIILYSKKKLKSKQKSPEKVFHNCPFFQYVTWFESDW